MFDGKKILVTGGTGSFGQRFVATLLERHTPERIIVYSRDELKQYEMSQHPDFAAHAGKLRYFIGDVRDLPRLTMAIAASYCRRSSAWTWKSRPSSVTFCGSSGFKRASSAWF